MGKIRAPYYRIVVADSRSKRDGRSIEEIGKYHPTEEPSFIEVDSARAQYWLGVGAQPSPQVEAILKLTGDWGIFKGDKGAKSTVRTKEAKVEFVADDKKKPVLKPKSEKPVAKVEAAPAVPADEVVSDGAVEEAPAAVEAPEVVPAGEEVPEAASAGDETPTDAAPVDAVEDADAADTSAEADKA